MGLLFRLHAWCFKQPLLLCSAAAAAGIFLADAGRWSPSWGLVACMLLLWGLFWHKPGLWRSLPAVACTFTLVHTFQLADTFDHPLRERLLAREGRPASAEIRGLLYPWNDGAELDETLALCETTEVRWNGRGPATPLKSQIKVRLPEGFTLTTPGTYAVKGHLSLPQPPKNPGQFDAPTYSLRMGWVAQMEASEVMLVEPAAVGLRFRLQFAAEASRQWITRQLQHGLEQAGELGGVILAMALGASDAAGRDIEDAFRDSGTLHVFAVSGLHVAMLAWIAHSALHWMGRQRLSVVLICLVFVYAYITGWRPSAARAAFMTAFLLAAPLFNRQPQMPNILGVAALILLAADSHQLFLPGFQLSFAVLLAIVVTASWLTDLVKPWWDLDPFLPPVLATRMQRFWLRRRRHAVSLLCVSGAAWVGSLPFMLGHFQTVTPVAIFSNLLLVPASGLCLVFSCASLVLAAVQWSSAVLFVNKLNLLLAQAMVAMATWFSSLPFASHTVDLRLEGPLPSAEIRVLHLPYGGAASFVRSGETRWLIDTGNERAWRGVVRPFLRHSGINRLSGLILTHADISHVGAVPWIMKAQQPSTLHTSVLEPWPLDPPFASLKKLSRTVVPEGPVWQRREQHSVLSLAKNEDVPVNIQVLYPGRLDLHEKADDRGLVLRMEMGGFTLLWLGDAGFITEKQLLETQAPVTCDILIRNQHSADASGLAELLLAARPQAIISSNDPEEKLPQRIRDYCSQNGSTLFDLEAGGSVGIRFSDGQAFLKAHSNSQTVRLVPKKGQR